MVNRSTTKNGLTEAQSEVLEFIKERCEQGLPPSYREIQGHFGYKAIGTVQDHIRALIKKGHLEKNERNARGITPIGFRRIGIKQIPIYGEIAAGAARDSQQLELGELAVSESLTQRASFALKVVGTSMIEVGIFEGDLLIVDTEQPVRSGDIVVALLDGETTVKRYLKRGKQVFLVPENKRMKPIPVTHQKLEIQGKVVGLQRRF